MELIFSRIEDFSDYKANIDVNKRLYLIPERWKSSNSSKSITVFLSHKHDELKFLYPIINFFEKNYNVTVYIDAYDPNMPSITCAETAIRLRKKIRNCRKFIFLATSASIMSKWCNWELGQGDALKFRKNMAIFPVLLNDVNFTGNEYLQMYSYILPSKDNQYSDDYKVVCTKSGKEISLRDWLNA